MLNYRPFFNRSTVPNPSFIDSKKVWHYTIILILSTHGSDSIRFSPWWPLSLPISPSLSLSSSILCNLEGEQCCLSGGSVSSLPGTPAYHLIRMPIHNLCISGSLFRVNLQSSHSAAGQDSLSLSPSLSLPLPTLSLSPPLSWSLSRSLVLGYSLLTAADRRALPYSSARQVSLPSCYLYQLLSQQLSVS